ncbi:hypothetical protein P9250_03020 [Caballeronia sp. LP006]|uniref:hypothetical protein n=1 Tax=Caballeronia sp. LP006 TaxID=3038552 RepID=UPI0028553E16|nr:hypothetical protein [Caballeronia sp. LP006]MDR5826827.1 hypothetical protein [Caballeronia sp. LP006]
MTTDSKFEIAANVFVENEVFNVPQKSLEEDFQLSAAVKLYTGRPLASLHENALTGLYRRINRYFSTHPIWLVISNGGKVPESRIVRHYGLWKALEKNGVQLPEGNRTQEYIVEGNQGIQYFGAICLNTPCFGEILKVMALRSSVHIVMSENENSVLKLLKDGWSYDIRKFPTSILRSVEQESMFFLAPLGEFDDMEGGAVALAKPAFIERCFSAARGFDLPA